MEDVASRAGFSKAGVYLYFKDKMALLQALVNEMAGAKSAVARGIAEQTPGAGVAAAAPHARSSWRGSCAHTRFPELIKVIISESRAHPDIGKLYLDNVITQGLPIFEGLIRRGIAVGRVPRVDPALAVKAMVAPMLLAVIWKTVFEPLGAETLDIEAYAAQHVDDLPAGDRGMKRLIIPIVIVALAVTAFLFRDRWLPQPAGQLNYLGYVEGETMLIGAPQAGRLVGVGAVKGGR